MKIVFMEIRYLYRLDFGGNVRHVPIFTYISDYKYKYNMMNREVLKSLNRQFNKTNMHNIKKHGQLIIS